MDQPQAGWYPDPSGEAGKLRWWDGAQWTDNYTAMPDSTQQADPAQQPAYAQPQAPDGSQSPYATAPSYYATPDQPLPYGGYATYPMTETDRTLRLINFILCVVSCVGSCWLLVPLAWMIPMTVHSWGIYKGTKPNTVAFGVCTLIFVTLIGGILLLVSKKDNQQPTNWQ